MNNYLSERNEELERVKALIGNTKMWNDGHGLIVSEVIADKLKELGITEGYSVTKTISCPPPR